MKLDTLLRDVLAGHCATREEARVLADPLRTDTEELCAAANEIRRQRCGDTFDLCAIVNGKSGRCSEDCKYCAQSARFSTPAASYPLLGTGEIAEIAQRHFGRGIRRFSVVTSGRTLSAAECDTLCRAYAATAHVCGVSLCASHGLLPYDLLLALGAAGVERYHHNLETSRRYFPAICTTHTYDDKIRTIRAAQRAGLSVCSGGILGLGETMEDRIDMAIDLRALGIRSVPVNILNPIPGTPLGDRKPLETNEIRRVVAVYRFLLPAAALRIAGGRGLLPDRGRGLFEGGANAAISGDMLTTSGIDTQSDIQMVTELGFTVGKAV